MKTKYFKAFMFGFLNAFSFDYGNSSGYSQAKPLGSISKKINTRFKRKD